MNNKFNRDINARTKQEADEHGAGNSKLTEPTPTYNAAPCEKVITGGNNTSIVLGRDRPGDRDSGLGGAGKPRCGSIDLVAGRVSADPKELSDDGSSVVVNNSIPYDAARLTLVQNSEGDSNHYLDSGSIGTRVSSFAVVKADNVRVVAREGIKLVTGVDKYLSNGNTKIEKFGIDLIAGNDSEDLQPIPKGDNLAELLNKLIQKIAQNNEEIVFLYKILMKLEAQLASHIHPSAMGPTGPAPNLISEAISTTTEIGAHLVNAQVTQASLMQLVVNYLKPYGAHSINSAWNNVN